MQNNEGGQGSLAIGILNLITAMMTSNPNNGYTPDDINKMIGSVITTFKVHSNVTGPVAITSDVRSGQETSAEGSSETGLASTTTTHTGHVEIAPVSEPAPAKARAAAKAGVVDETPAAGGRKSKATAAPAAEEAPLVVSEAPLKGRRGKTQAVEAATLEAAPAEEVSEEAAVEEAPEVPAVALDPLSEEYLVAKFGPEGKNLSREPFMDPEAAIETNLIVNLIDGSKRKMIQRRLLAEWDMLPGEYIRWFGLRADYPMTAPGYSKEKSVYAKKVGLGTTQFIERAKGKATPKMSRRTRGQPKKATQRGAASTVA